MPQNVSCFRRPLVLIRRRSAVASAQMISDLQLYCLRTPKGDASYMRRIICAVLLSLLAAGADAQAPTVRTGTTEVLVDVVVRDKKSKIVRDLKPEEIQVLEDGDPQTIRHFELFEGRAPGDDTGPASAAASAAALAHATPAAQAPLVRTLREATVVSVVVGSLNPEGRKSARDAVRDFIKNELRPNTFVGVFAWTYTGMQTLQGYTNDGARISEAMERVVKWTGLRKIDDADLVPDTVESATPPARTAPGRSSPVVSRFPPYRARGRRHRFSANPSISPPVPWLQKYARHRWCTPGAFASRCTSRRKRPQRCWGAARF